MQVYEQLNIVHEVDQQQLKKQEKIFFWIEANNCCYQFDIEIERVKEGK